MKSEHRISDDGEKGLECEKCRLGERFRVEMKNVLVGVMEGDFEEGEGSQVESSDSEE